MSGYRVEQDDRHAAAGFAAPLARAPEHGVPARQQAQEDWGDADRQHAAAMAEAQHRRRQEEAARRPAAVPGQTVEYGVVLFDNRIPGPGWACRHGRGAQRVSSVAELGTGAIWWTNIEYDVMRDHGLSENPWLRHAGYLRSSLLAILDDWGFHEKPAAELAPILAECFTRIMRWSSMLLRESRFEDSGLAGDLAKLFPKPETPPADAAPAIQHSVQDWTRTQLKRPDHTELVTLRLPRMGHAFSVLSTPVPLGPWEWLDGAALPGGGTEKQMEWIARQQRPVLARMNITGLKAGTPPMYANILAFGAGARDRKTNTAIRRAFVTQPELIAIASMFEIEIDGLWMGSAFSHLLPEGGPLDMLFRNAAATASWSLGVLAENCVAAAKKSPRERRRGSGEPPISFRSAWLTAADRMACFIASCRLYDRGHVPISYSMGSIKVAVYETKLVDLVKDGFRLGLVPAFDITTRPDFPRLTPPVKAWGGGPEGLPEAILRVSGKWDHLRQLDALPDMPPEEASRLVRTLMSN